MRKFGFIMSAITAAVMVSPAMAADYEVTPLAGKVKPEGNLGLYNENTLGGAFQVNYLSDIIKPEVMYLVTRGANYKGSSATTVIKRYILNGVHEYGALGSAIPFMKAGVGFEQVLNQLNDNTNSVLVDAGLGFKFPLNDMFALRGEALYMLKNNDNRWDNNLAVLAGVTFSFGSSEPAPAPEPVVAAPADGDGDGVADDADKCPGTPAGVSVDANGCPLDGDKDGVADTMDKCPDTPAGATVNADGCQPDSDGDGVADAADKCAGTPAGEPVDAEGCELDSDNDGIIDRLDKCPSTPAGFKVDAEGCPVVKSLKLTFKSSSAKIAADSEAEVAAFAEFLKDSPAYSVKIVGHTDSTGSAKFNMALSKKRAQSVKDMLVADGVDAKRITAEGKGASEPIADNKTKEGRAENRRIDAWLVK